MLSVLNPISESRPCTSSSSSPGSEIGKTVESWQQQEVADWLEEIGMKEYQVYTEKMLASLERNVLCMQDLFDEHAVESGRGLLRLEEDHLKEMGVAKVGHRLQLCEHLRELRRAARVSVGGLDMDCLLSQ